MVHTGIFLQTMDRPKTYEHAHCFIGDCQIALFHTYSGRKKVMQTSSSTIHGLKIQLKQTVIGTFFSYNVQPYY